MNLNKKRMRRKVGKIREWITKNGEKKQAVRNLKKQQRTAKETD